MRDTYKYQIKRGNKIIHRGITNDLDRRHGEHKRTYGDDVKIIQIDVCQEELNNNSNSCVGLHGDIKAVVGQVCTSVFVLQVATPVSVTCCWYQMVLHHVRSWI